MSKQQFRVTYTIHDESGKLLEEQSVVVDNHSDTQPIKAEFKEKSKSRKDKFKTSPYFGE